MFTEQELEEIIVHLRGGASPEEAAKALGLARMTLIYRLAQSGKRIRIVRELEDIIPVETGDQRREPIAA